MRALQQIIESSNDESITWNYDMQTMQNQQIQTELKVNITIAVTIQLSNSQLNIFYICFDLILFILFYFIFLAWFYAVLGNNPEY